MGKRRFFGGLLLALSVILLIERAAVMLDVPALYPIIWLTINVMILLTGTFMWNVAGEVCDARQAKRLFSLFASAGILGGVLGNLLTGPLVTVLGTENVLLVNVAFLLIALALMRRIARLHFKPGAQRVTKSSTLDDIRFGFDYMRGSRLMQLLALASILFSVLFFSLSFPFSQVVSTSFAEEADVANYLGGFSSVATIVTFCVSLFIANRLYASIGVVNAVLLLPIVYLGGFIAWSVNFTLTSAAIVRLLQWVLLNAVAGTAWNAFFNVVRPEKRGRVLAFMNGVPTQIGTALSGVLLILGRQVMTAAQIFVLGMIVAVICGVTVWLMRRAYGAALVAALRAGFLDVFTATAQGMRKLEADADAIDAVCDGLRDPRPEVRRVSAEILGRLDARAVRQPVEPLKRALLDENADVRYAALSALRQLDPQAAVEPIVDRLADPEPAIRAAAIDALSQIAPQFVDRFVAALNDAHAHVRARAAVALHRVGEIDRARAAMMALLGSAQAAKRVEALEALADCKDVVQAARIASFLRDDENVRVRIAATKVLGALGTIDAGRLLVEALDDPQERVRHAAALALRANESALDAIVDVLLRGSERAQDAALSALEGRGQTVKATLIDWAAKRLPRVAELRRHGAALGHASNDSFSVTYIHDLLHQREWQIERRIVRALALISSPEATDLILRGLRATDAETRAQALEAIDAIGDKRIARGLIPLMEQHAPEPSAGDTRETLKRLTEDLDPWIRVLAVRALGELLARDWRALIAHAQEDAAAIVRESVADIQSMGGAMAETLNTLGMMDRILFLRQVSIFKNLAPEDLHQIAEIATERVFAADEVIYREGDIGDEMSIIVDGQVRVTTQVNGETQYIRSYGVGEHVGELALLRQQPRSADVTAEQGDVRVLVIRGDAFKAILHDRPEVAMAMLGSLAERLGTLI
jgi:HEAT repeat protein